MSCDRRWIRMGRLTLLAVDESGAGFVRRRVSVVNWLLRRGGPVTVADESVARFGEAFERNEFSGGSI